MEAVGRESLDGGDGLTDEGSHLGNAGADGTAVDQDGAGTADAFTAAVLGSLEVQGIAEDPQERGIRRYVDGSGFIVDE